MLTWKRLSIIMSLLVFGLVALQLINVREVAAQVRAALVRSQDEPARVPYFVSALPTCPFGNECYVSGTVVPAGKRLRVTRLEGNLLNQTSNFEVALGLNGDLSPVLMFPVETFSGAFFGTVVSFNQEVDFYFEAGQTPYLEVGNTTTIFTDPRNRLTIAGYIVDLLP